MKPADTDYTALTDHFELEATLTCDVCGWSDTKEGDSESTLAGQFHEDGWNEMTGETDDEPLSAVWCPECVKG